jgi:hypothetical protein
MASGPSPTVPGSPAVLYRARPGPLIIALVVVLLSVITLSLLGGLLLALLLPERPHWVLAAVCLLIMVVLDALVLLLLRPSFTVSTAGIVDRALLSTRRIPWSEIAAIEIEPAAMDRGATVIVRRDGRRVRSGLTSSRRALYRGESPFDHGPDLLHPARPTRAASDAHRRYLRGEFGGL